MPTTVIKKSIRMIKKFFYDNYHFSLAIAHYNFWCEFANFNIFPKNINEHIKSEKFKLIIEFLEKKYSVFIKNYKNKNIPVGENCKKIWVCWWQGEENAPEIVKKCINSIKIYKQDYDVVIIDKNNFSDYIKIPEIILEKVKEGKISITHFSDLLRMGLLSKYGGVWVDATVYICSDVFKEFDNCILNSNCVEYAKKTNYADKWCGFFIGGKPNKLFSFVYDFMVKYDIEYDQLINYFLIDYAIHIAYDSFEECKEYIDSISIKNNKIFSLVSIFNDKCNKEQFESYCKENRFFKLTYKARYRKKTKLGDPTFYYYFINLKGDKNEKK